MKNFYNRAAVAAQSKAVAAPAQFHHAVGRWPFGPDAEGPVGGAAKRTLDVTTAAMMLLFLSPLMVGLALLVTSTSQGGAIYGHSRVGYGNRSFRCKKFRTMVANGDEVLADHLARNPLARIEWEETMKLENDPRVTRLGGVLRKLSLDELPQLFNVLKGEMSLVGPRPVTAEELTRYGLSSRYYLRARPGITGLWQVSGRNTTSYSRRTAFDRLYVTRRTDAKDAAILIRTLPAALRSAETS